MSGAASLRLPAVAGLLALSLVVFAACGGSDQGGGTQGGGGQVASSLNGAGATFPAPLYQRMFQQFAQISGIQVNYQAVGSGAGIQQFTNKTVDFGASDVPMTDEQMQSAGGNPQHIATVGGAVVATYNLSGVQSVLKLSGQTLADIFQGRITKWNDPASPGITRT